MTVLTIINMGSGKSVAGNPTQIWVRLATEIDGEPVARYRNGGGASLAAWDADFAPFRDKRDNADPLLSKEFGVDGFYSKLSFAEEVSIEADRAAARGSQFVLVNDGPDTFANGVTAIRTAMVNAADACRPDTVNIVGHSRGAWLAWPGAEEIARSHRDVVINMFLIDPVRRAFNALATGKDKWMEQYTGDVTGSATSTQQEIVSDMLAEHLDNVHIMYMTATSRSFPKMRPVLRGRHLFEARDLQIIPALRDRYPYRARGIRGGAFEMPGKHGSATETRTNPFLAHFALRRIRAFLKDAGTRFRRGVRIPDAGQLRDLFGVVMTTHCPATAHAWSAWDESGLFQKTIEKEAVPWTLEDTNLRRALMVTGSYVTTGMVD